MDRGSLTTFGVIAVGVVFGLIHARRPHIRIPKSWVFGVLLVLLAGLLLAFLLGSESLTWLFGLSLMAALSIMLPFAFGSAIGSFLWRHGKHK
jgi:hypothetical protein